MRKILNIAAAAAFTLLCGCSSDSFYIEGEVEGLGTQNVRIVYVANDAVQNVWVPAMESKFNFSGISREPTVVELYSRDLTRIAHFVMQNGDEISLKGKLSEPYVLTVEGDKLNTRWAEWVASHASEIAKGDSEAVRQAIEKLVKNTPDDPLVPLLVGYDYMFSTTDAEPALRLLAQLPDSEMKTLAEAHIGAVSDGSAASPGRGGRIPSFALITNADTLTSFVAGRSRASLLYFWLPENATHRADIRLMKRIKNRFTAAQLQLADISLESDTAVWKRTLRGDSAMTQWPHFWALGGVANPEMRRLGVNGTPVFIAIDSDGRQLYRGSSADEAEAALNDYLKHKPDTLQ